MPGKPRNPKDIHELLDGKWDAGNSPKELYGLHVAGDPGAYVEQVMGGLASDRARVRNGCAEIASLLSEDSPELLRPFIDRFIENLDAREKILRWEAVCTLGNLASADKGRRIAPAVDRIAGFLKDKSVVLQGHAVRALAKIAAADPGRAGSILDLLIAAEKGFPGNKVGFVIEAMERIVDLTELHPKIRSFVGRHLSSDVKVVARKAGKVMKLLDAR